MFHACYSLLLIELIATSQRASLAWTQLSNIPEVRVLALLDDMERSPFFSWLTGRVRWTGYGMMMTSGDHLR
jgi:hypothetical protein